MIMRLGWLAAVLVIWLFNLLPQKEFIIVFVGVLASTAYQLFIFPLLAKSAKQLASQISLYTFILPLLLLVYVTGGIESAFYPVIYFSVIGIALSFGRVVGLIYGFLAVGMVILMVLFPLGGLAGTQYDPIVQVILLALFVPFAGIAAKRYVDVQRQGERLEKLSAQLTETLRHERDMLDILGHELRTPLGTVRNAIKMLLRSKANGQLTDEQLNKYLVMSDENSVRLAKILETILSSTKIDNNRLTLSFDKVDMQDAVNDTVEANRRRAEEKGLQLNVEAPAQIFSYGDRDRVQEIVDNLVDNAIKYTDKGSISIKLKQVDQLIILDVIDTGKGIPDGDIPKLGEKFYRSQTYLDNKELDVIRPGGTGLGLYVTFSLAKAMGGEIVVSSKMGEGSVFSLRVPAYTGQEVKKGITMQDLIEEKFKGTQVAS